MMILSDLLIIFLEMGRSMTEKRKNIVYWYDSEGNEIIIPVKRTPLLGWHSMTLLEKCMDSAKTSLHIQMKKEKPDFTTALLSLNKGLAIVRADIEKAKKQNPQLLFNRCEFRETSRTRCRSTPVRFDISTNSYRCRKHHTRWEIVI